MSSALAPKELSTVTRATWDAFVRSAQPGDKLCYASGYRTWEVNQDLTHHTRSMMDYVRTYNNMGMVALFQERQPEDFGGECLYWAVRISPSAARYIDACGKGWAK